MPCFPATLQAPVKGFCQPAVWMPGVKNLHSHTECWKLDGDPTHCVDETLIAVELLNELEHPNEYYVNKFRYDIHWVQIFCYTPTGWLDVMEITFLSAGGNSSIAKVVSSSTGVLPAWLPFGFLCDMLLCWLPFSDHGSNSVRCQSLREVLPFTIVQLDGKESDNLLAKSSSKQPLFRSEKKKLY